MTPPVICLPGLAADRRLFAPQLAAFGSARVPDWPAAGGSTTLPGFAAALRRSLEAQGLWSPETILLGFSFGAQVALTMTLGAPRDGAAFPRAILLVSGLWTAEQLTPRFRRQTAVGRLIPNRTLRWAARTLVAPRFACGCDLSPEQSATLLEMARDLDAAQLKRHSRLAARWRFSPSDLGHLRDAGVRLAGIHARRDPVIPPPNGPPPECKLLDDGVHLLTWTHAEEVNDLIRRELEP
jgi:pimeloyl-ACP methyl ester carboxylesterase